jgi:hypothetical protein
VAACGPASPSASARFSRERQQADRESRASVSPFQNPHAFVQQPSTHVLMDSKGWLRLMQHNARSQQ